MCGILAQLNAYRDERYAVAAKMIEHRGIRQKTVTNKTATLTHSRLPIIGLEEAFDQPVEVGDDEYLGFVGELFDFRDGRPDAKCDTEVVAEIWKKDGPKGFRTRDGFWSIVVAGRGAIFALCDYLCQKPLYYRSDVKAVCSEIDPLVELGVVFPDRLYLSDVLKWGYCPDQSRTPYEEIKKVLPGNFIMIADQPRVQKVYIDKLYPRSVSPDDLRHEIERATWLRVSCSDVPVGLLYSGGLDSSITLALSRWPQNFKRSKIVPYYVSGSGFPNGDHLKFLTPDEYLNLESCSWKNVDDDEDLKYMQEPIDLGSLNPQIALSKTVKERVCLTGDGADELFGGYGRATNYDSQQSDIWRELVMWHLPRLDRVMMRNQVEVRTPFLARNVVEAALGTPWVLRRDKKILRDVFRPELGALADVPKEPLRSNHDRFGRSKYLVNRFIQQRWPHELLMA